MKRIVNTILIVGLMLVTIRLWAAAGNGEQKGKTPLAHKQPPVYTYLGNSVMNGGAVPKATFDALLKQGLHAKDSLGGVCTIVSFDFNYVERNLYEDSAGKLMVVPDYLLEHCFGDTITKDIAASIYDRTKEGDTTYFDNIVVTRPDGSPGMGKSMKFTITK